MNLFLGRPGSKNIAASADNLCIAKILWVDIIFHSLEMITQGLTLIKSACYGNAHTKKEVVSLAQSNQKNSLVPFDAAQVAKILEAFLKLVPAEPDFQLLDHPNPQLAELKRDFGGSVTLQRFGMIPSDFYGGVVNGMHVFRLNVTSLKCHKLEHFRAQLVTACRSLEQTRVVPAKGVVISGGAAKKRLPRIKLEPQQWSMGMADAGVQAGFQKHIGFLGKLNNMSHLPSLVTSIAPAR
jgi:hypothetical protein